MSLKFNYEVGIERVYGRERIADGVEMFCAFRLSDDKYESRVGEVIYGETPQELAKNVKSKIMEEARDKDFSWQSSEIEVNPQDRSLKRMSYSQYHVDFLNAMSFAPQRVSVE